MVLIPFVMNQVGNEGHVEAGPLGQRPHPDRPPGFDPDLRHPHVLRHLPASGLHQTHGCGARSAEQN